MLNANTVLFLIFSLIIVGCNENSSKAVSEKTSEQTSQRVKKNNYKKFIHNYPFNFSKSVKKFKKNEKVWAFLPYPKFSNQGRWAFSKIINCLKYKCSVIQNNILYKNVPKSVILKTLNTKFFDTKSQILVVAGKNSVFLARFLKLENKTVSFVRLWKNKEKTGKVPLYKTYFIQSSYLPMNLFVYKKNSFWIQGMFISFVDDNKTKVAMVKRLGGSVDYVDKKDIKPINWGYIAKLNEKVLSFKSSSAFLRVAYIKKKSLHSMLYDVSFMSGIKRINVPFWEVIKYDSSLKK